MSISKLCSSNVVTVDKGASLKEAIKRMRAAHVGSLVVTETQQGNKVPVSMLTDRDIVIKVLAEDIALQDMSVEDLMSGELLAIQADTGVYETITQMRVKGVRRAPIIDKQGHLIGLVAIDDLLKLLADELHEIASLIKNEQHRERQRSTIHKQCEQNSVTH